MAKTTVEVEILAVLKQAQKDVKDFSKETQKQLDGINFKSAVSAINAGFELIERTAGAAFGAVKGFISDAIAEASEGEEALTRVSNSMRLVGDFTEEAVDDFKAFADALQETTTNSDDAVLSALALAKNFGLTNKEAKQATLAAIDFAAATGKDLDSAVQSVARTFTGFVDKDLAKYAPALKAASKEQLVLGEGARVIGERFEGFANALGNTFQGSLAKTRNSFDNLLETVGELIIKNPVLIQSIQIIGDVFKQLSGEVTANKEQIGLFISETIKGVAALAPAVIQSVRGIDFLFTSIKNLFQATGLGIAGFLAATEAALSGDFSGAKEAAQATADDIVNIYRKSADRQKGFYDPLIKAAEDASEKIQKIGLGDLKKGEIKLTVSKSDAEIIGDRTKNALVEGAEEVKRKIEEAFNLQKKNVEDLSRNPISSLIPAARPGGRQALTNKQQNAVATGAGALNSVLGGAAGATALVKGFASAAAEALVPGLGAVAGEIVGVLAKGPEEVKKMVREFAQAIPTIIEAIAESFPVLIEEISRTLPPALAKTMPTVAVGFSTALLANIPQIVKGFAQGLIDAAKGFVQAIIDEIKGAAGDVFGGISGSGSGGIFEGIPILGGIGDIFGFAEGGRIPDVPRFANDGAIIRADAGEQILNGDLTDKLEAFLDGTGSETNVTVNFVMGDQVLASQIFRLNRGGFRLS